MLLSPPFQNLLVGFIKPFAVVWGARENGHLDQSSFPNLSKHPTKSLVRSCKDYKNGMAGIWSHVTPATFLQRKHSQSNGFIHSKLLEFKALKFFCGDFSRTSNSHETKSYEERKHILEALVCWVHVWLLQSFDWFRAIFKYLLFTSYKALGDKHLQSWRNFWESKRNILILHFASEKNCWHSYLDVIQIISKHIETVRSTILHPHVIHVIPGPRISPDRPTCRAKCPKIGCPSEASKTHQYAG